MEMEKSETPGPTTGDRPTASWAVWLLRVASVGALALACYLAWTSLRASQVAGCDGGGIFDCTSVLQSRWSKWLGLPVSIPAACVYAILLATLCFVGSGAAARTRQVAWSIVTVLALSAGAAAVWFTFLQLFVLHGLCLYCIAVHITGLVIMVVVLLTRPLAMGTTARLSGIAVIGIGILIAGQVLVEPPPSYKIETYTDDGAPSDDQQQEPPFTLGPADESDVMELVLPEDESEQGEQGGPKEPLERKSQTAETPGGGASKAALPSRSVTAAAGADTPHVSRRQTPRPPQPSLGPVPGEMAAVDSSRQHVAAPVPRENNKRIVTVLGGRARLDIKNRPIVGSPEAKYILVELFDYTCPHCRTMHEYLKVVRRRYGNQIAILTLPLPLNSQCNSAIFNTSYTHRYACDLARCALAVWRYKPDAFPQFHDWLFQPSNGRSPAEAKTEAATLIGAETLRKELNGSVLNKFFEQHAGLYRRAGKGTIPKLMAATFTITGKTNSADDLCRRLEQHLQLKRVK